MVFDRTRHPILKMLQAVLSLFYRRHTVTGSQHVKKDEPAVFVCNHLKSYAPIAISLYLPFRFRPWVQANVVSSDLCSAYLEEDFVKKELHLRPPLSRWVASIVAPLCIRLMKSINAIPVYRTQLRIRETFQISVEALKQGWNLVIFPESKTRHYSQFINDFQTGFAQLAWLYFRETDRHIAFYPVFVDSTKREIKIGKAVSLADRKLAAGSRKHMAGCLRDAINEMAGIGSR